MKILAVSGMLILIWSCTMGPVYTHYLVGSGKIPVTRIDSERGGFKTYIYYGNVKQDKLPATYLIVNDKPLRGGFQALLMSEGDKVILLQPYSYFKKVGHDKNIVIKEMDDQDFSAIFFDKKQTRYLRMENRSY